MNTLKNLYQQAFKKTRDGILILSGEKIADCNLSARTILKIEDKAFRDRSIFEYTTNTIQRQDQLIDIDAIVFQDIVNGFEGKMEWEFHGSKGNRIFVELIVSHFSAEDIPYTMVILRDISDRKLFDLVLNARLSLLEIAPALGFNDFLEKAIDEIQLISESPMVYFYIVNPSDQRIKLKSFRHEPSDQINVNAIYDNYLDTQNPDFHSILIEKHRPIIRRHFNHSSFVPILPQLGPVKLKTELLIPIISNQKLAAIIGLANRVHGYSKKNLKVIRMLGNIIWDLAEKKLFEDQLSLSQSLLTETKRMAQLGIWEYDVIEDHFYYNNYLSELLEGDSCITKNNWLKELKKITHPDDMKRVADYYTTIIKDRETREIEYRIVTHQGQIKYISSSAFCIISQENLITRLVGIVRDISKSIRLEKALCASEERFRGIYETSGVGMIIANINGKIISANHAFCEMIGHKEYELLQRKIQTLISPDDLKRLEPDLAQFFKQKTGQLQMEVELQTKKKQKKWGQMTCNCFFESDPPATHLIVAVQDITHRKYAEEMLAINERNFREFFDCSMISLLVLDTSGNIIKANHQTCKMLGYTEAELYKLNINSIRSFGPHQSFIDQKMLLGKEISELCTIPFLTKNREEIPVQSSIGRGKWNDNEAYFCVTRDLTDLKLSEEKYNKAFHQNGNPMLIIRSTDSAVIEANSRCEALTGYSIEEILGITQPQINPLVDWDLKSYLDELAEGQNFEVFHQLKRKNGEYAHVVLYIAPLVIHNILHHQISMCDISEKIKTEVALMTSEERLREITENVQEGIMLTDMNFETVFVNDTFSKMTGFSKDELLQMDIHHLLVYPDDIEKVQKIRNELGAYNSRYVAIKRKDGSIFYINVSAKQIKIGQKDYILGTQQDVTVEYEAHNRLLKAYEENNSLKNQLEQENIYLRQEIIRHHGFDEIITQNQAFRKILSQVSIVSPTDASVLIFGETGTGKELIAKAIHKQSNRAGQPLIKLNCAAIPESLIESELFGHEKGAFTGAFQQKIGRFEIAHGGTLFLDEIGEMPLELQSKLLRVLQEGEFERIGGNKTIKVDVRIVAATNRDLEEDIEKGKFRRDLFYRLNVFPIKVPSLRDRIDDISLLTNYFVERFNKKFNKNISKIPSNLMTTLLNYDWPGNIRELENLIERSVILSHGSTLEISGLKSGLTESKKIRFVSFEEMQRRYILDVLNHTNWRISGDNGATRILDMKYSTLTSKMQKLGISKFDKQP